MSLITLSMNSYTLNQIISILPVLILPVLDSSILYFWMVLLCLTGLPLIFYFIVHLIFSRLVKIICCLCIRCIPLEEFQNPATGHYVH